MGIGQIMTDTHTITMEVCHVYQRPECLMMHIKQI
jgi:hypothetical protein